MFYLKSKKISPGGSMTKKTKKQKVFENQEVNRNLPSKDKVQGDAENK